MYHLRFFLPYMHHVSLWQCSLLSQYCVSDHLGLSALINLIRLDIAVRAAHNKCIRIELNVANRQPYLTLVTASLFMVLTITYKYLSPISNDINILCCVCFYFVALDVSLGFHFLFCVCYVNPAYGCRIEINCMYVCMYYRNCFTNPEQSETPTPPATGTTNQPLYHSNRKRLRSRTQQQVTEKSSASS